jgi:ABC-type transport system involved in multi-copper enzyme maturation permease subunit
MARTIGALIRWEVSETYRPPMLELVMAVLVVQVLGAGKQAVGVGDVAQAAMHVALVLDRSFPLAMLLLTVLVSTSVAGSLESGETKLLLSYPLSRLQVLLVKVGVSYGVFLAIYSATVWCVVVTWAPYLLFNVSFPLILAGVATYLFFFVSVTTFVALVSRSVKTSMAIMVLFCLSILLGLNSLIMRAGSFLISLVVTYGEIGWAGFTFGSSVQVLFLPVFVAHLVIALLLFGVSIIYFSWYMEV